jgi:excisionase family DNA binding protein
MQKLLTVRQAAEFLALRPATIRKMILQRRLPVVRIGRSVRIKEIDLEGIVRDGYRRPLEV